MKKLVVLFIITLLSFAARADSTDHWKIFVDAKEVFECVATCSAGGVNTTLLQASQMLEANQQLTIAYMRDTKRTKVTKVIYVSDSTVTSPQLPDSLVLQKLPVYDESGSHFITLNTNDLKRQHGIILWYSEEWLVGKMLVKSRPVAIVYFR